MTDYEKQANDFLDKTNTEFSFKFLKSDKYFDDDKEIRDIYEITLKRNERQYTFNFGQSLINSGFYWSFANCKTKNYIDRKHLNHENIKAFVKNNYNNDFGSVKADSVHYPVNPTAYDVLYCLTKYDPYDFENFCADYGYNTDSRKAEKIYHAAKDEYQNICMLFSDSELEELREIN